MGSGPDGSKPFRDKRDTRVYSGPRHDESGKPTLSLPVSLTSSKDSVGSTGSDKKSQKRGKFGPRGGRPGKKGGQWSAEFNNISSQYYGARDALREAKRENLELEKALGEATQRLELLQPVADQAQLEAEQVRNRLLQSRQDAMRAVGLQDKGMLNNEAWSVHIRSPPQSLLRYLSGLSTDAALNRKLLETQMEDAHSFMSYSTAAVLGVAVGSLALIGYMGGNGTRLATGGLGGGIAAAVGAAVYLREWPVGIKVQFLEWAEMNGEADRRPDAMTIGELKHKDPLLAWVKVSRYGLLSPNYMDFDRVMVSFEGVAQLLSPTCAEPMASMEETLVRMKASLRAMHGINWPLDLVLGGQDIFGNTVLLAALIHERNVRCSAQPFLSLVPR